MIISFKKKALKALYKKDDPSKLAPSLVPNIRAILSALDVAATVEELGYLHKNLHPFKEKDPVVWSLDVNANVRILFSFDKGNAFDVDLKDTHKK